MNITPSTKLVQIQIVIAFFVFCIVFSNFVSAQTIITPVSAPAIQWQKEYGDEFTEAVANMIQTSDGGYAFLDLGANFQESITASTLYKLNSSGDVQWRKIVRDWFTANNIVQTRDGGYEISGAWNTYGSGYGPGNPIIYASGPALIKTDSEGNVQWVKNYSSSTPNLGTVALSQIQTSDGGTASIGQGNIEQNVQGSIVKTDSNGNVQWIKNFTSLEQVGTLTLSSLIETSDGAILAIGVDVYNYQYHSGNIYLVKTDAFLPLPKHSPLPTPIATPITVFGQPILTVAIIAAGVTVVVLASVVLLVYLKKRKRMP
jgi:hypothetical protein